MSTIGFELATAYREVMGWDITDLSPERPWTRDQQEYLVDLYERGYTLQQMAKEMGRSNGYILGRLFDMGEQDVITPAMRGIKARGQVPRLVGVGV